MCAPMAVVGLVMGVAQSVVSYQASMQDYHAKADVWKQNYVNSLAAGRDEQRQLQLRQIQEQDALSQKLKLSEIEEAEAEATAEVSAASSGVSGISVDNILSDIGRKSSRNREADRLNYQNTALQISEEMKGVNTKIENRINSVERPTKPSSAGLILGVAGAGFKAAQQGGILM